MDSSKHLRGTGPVSRFRDGSRSRDPPVKARTKRMLKRSEQRLLEIAHEVG